MDRGRQVVIQDGKRLGICRPLRTNLTTHSLQPLRRDSTPHYLAAVSTAAGSLQDCSAEGLRGRPCQLRCSCRLTRATLSIRRISSPCLQACFPFGGVGRYACEHSGRDAGESANPHAGSGPSIAPRRNGDQALADPGPRTAPDRTSRRTSPGTQLLTAAAPSSNRPKYRRFSRTTDRRTSPSVTRLIVEVGVVIDLLAVIGAASGPLAQWKAGHGSKPSSGAPVRRSARRRARCRSIRP